MTSRTAAARYARAVLDVATKESADLDAIARELDEFIAFITQQPALAGLMLNPAVPAPRKRAAMEQITKISGVDADRLEAADPARRSRPPGPAQGCLGDLPRFPRRSAEHGARRGDERGAAARTNAFRPIEQRLATVTGKRVSMTTRVDKDIIGGVVARVGSTIYDASIATQLKKIRERLTT